MLQAGLHRSTCPIKARDILGPRQLGNVGQARDAVFEGSCGCCMRGQGTPLLSSLLTPAYSTRESQLEFMDDREGGGQTPQRAKKTRKLRKRPSALRAIRSALAFGKDELGHDTAEGGPMSP
ncbi:hypothetical protein NDU88_006504 [Pleurodeles waltl]|uniref:Uncharacterized protein n=1 Tax=Pleurodeles waltl TaxID=8319 RepID=A0AAV7SPS9_PLEWA|nr:hypothetical protein NDU88_006504 [Pleurodeles waltl]